MNSTTDQPFDPRHNITAQELDRDLTNLHLPAIDLIATEEECEAMYPPGVYQQMMNRIEGQNKESQRRMLPD